MMYLHFVKYSVRLSVMSILKLVKKEVSSRILDARISFKGDASTGTFKHKDMSRIQLKTFSSLFIFLVTDFALDSRR